MSRTEPSHGDSTDPAFGDPGAFFRSRLALWMYLAIALAVAVHLGLRWTGEAPPTLEYSRFLESVEVGDVQRVEIVNDTQIRGTFTASAVAGAPDRDRRAFTTTKPADHELTAFLRAHNAAAEERDGTTVAFTARTDGGWGQGQTLLLWLLPVLGLGAAGLYVLARRTEPGAQMLNLGGNNATLFQDADRPTATFDDVAGVEEAKEEVAEVVQFLRRPERYTRLGGQLPTGVLLVGPPGTGKTLLARAVAGEAGVPFFSISGSDFVEMFVGVGARRVRDLFERAKDKAPCIIFIDEVDAIGRSRGPTASAGGSDERENTLNQLLAEMDGFASDEGVIIMAATNRPDVLDAALLRPGRFDRQIVLDTPDRPAREAIFRVHVRDLRLGDDVDLALLAGQTPGFAGAEIANVCNEAALLAARKEKDVIEMTDFEESMDRVVAGLEKKNPIISAEERKVMAYHEAGHAVVGWFLEHTDPVVKVSIVPRGLSALGHAQYLPEERSLYSTEALNDRIAMALGGRVAEKLVFDRVTTGAQDDLERVTEMAYAMVTDYGMSDRLGAVSFVVGDREESASRVQHSDATARLIDEEVRSIIDEAWGRAATLLRRRREQLDQMADRLLEQEVLGPDALVGLLGERPYGEYVDVERHARAGGNGGSRGGTGRGGSSSESVANEETAETRENEVP